MEDIIKSEKWKIKSEKIKVDTKVFILG
jgi:hypothetical protein